MQWNDTKRKSYSKKSKTLDRHNNPNQPGDSEDRVTSNVIIGYQRTITPTQDTSALLKLNRTPSVQTGPSLGNRPSCCPWL